MTVVTIEAVWGLGNLRANGHPSGSLLASVSLYVMRRPNPAMTPLLHQCAL